MYMPVYIYIYICVCERERDLGAVQCRGQGLAMRGWSPNGGFRRGHDRMGYVGIGPGASYVAMRFGCREVSTHQLIDCHFMSHHIMFETPKRVRTVLLIVKLNSPQFPKFWPYASKFCIWRVYYFHQIWKFSLISLILKSQMKSVGLNW